MKTLQKTLMLLCFLIINCSEIAFTQVPYWLWARSPQGTGDIESHAVAVDATGNTYSTGWYYNTDLTFGATTLNYSADGDIYIVKYDSSGNVTWAISAGGNGFDETRSISVDPDGNVYVTGVFDGPNLTIGGVILSNNNSGTIDMFVAKFDSAGVLLWAQSAGGPDREFAEQIAIDFAGNVLVAGSFESATLSFGAVTLNNINPNNEDVYVVKYDTDGNILWAKSGGGSGLEWATCVTADPYGNVIIAGPTYSDSIVFDANLLVNAAGNEGTFIVKFDSTGNVIWTKQVIGNNFFNELYSLATDAFGSVFVTGTTNSDSIAFDATVVTLPDGGYFDMILGKYDAGGNLLWATKTGGYGSDYAFSVTTDESGNAYVVGHFDSDTMHFDSFNNVTINTNYYSDLFLVKYDNGGNVIWAKSTGGVYQPASYGYAQQGVVNDGNGNIFTVGCFVNDSLLFDNDTLFIGTASVNAFVARLHDASPCSADFYLAPDSTTLHLYWAVNQATGIPPLTYLWDWGDGNTDSTQYPSHTYAVEGFYPICLTITDSSGCSNTECHTTFLQRTNNPDQELNTMVVVNVVPFIPTSIEESVNEIECMVYPNPVLGMLTIEVTKQSQVARLNINDLSGRMVFSKVFDTPNKIELNTSEFDLGIYTLNIETQKEVFIKKLMIVK